MFEKSRGAATFLVGLARDRLDTARAQELYQVPESGFAEPANCVVCLRAYDAAKAHSGGSDRLYCAEACRKRADDSRRRSLPTQWRDCPECQVSFFCLTVGQAGRRQADGSWTSSTGKVLCPPAWPAEYWDRSPCYSAHRRRQARLAMRQHRARQPDNEGLLSLAIYRDAELRPFYTFERIAANRGLGVEAVTAAISQVAEWLAHARACTQRRACPHLAHGHMRTINKLLDDLYRAAPYRVDMPPSA